MVLLNTVITSIIYFRASLLLMLYYILTHREIDTQHTQTHAYTHTEKNYLFHRMSKLGR